MPTLSFLPNFSGAFARMNPVNIPAKFEARSFTRSWDNSGYSNKLGRPWMAFVRMDALKTSAKFEVRSFTRPWNNRGYSKSLRSPWIDPRSLFSQIFRRLLLGWILWIYLPNLKLVALRVPEIIGGTPKIWEVPGFAHAPSSPKFLKGFVRMDPLNIPAKFEVRSFTQSWDYRGTVIGRLLSR